MVNFDIPPNFYENLRIISVMMMSDIPNWLENPTNAIKMSLISKNIHKYVNKQSPPNHLSRYLIVTNYLLNSEMIIF